MPVEVHGGCAGRNDSLNTVLDDIHAHGVTVFSESVAYAPLGAGGGSHGEVYGAVALKCRCEVEVAGVEALVGGEEAESVAVGGVAEEVYFGSVASDLCVELLELNLVNHCSAACEGDFHKLILKHNVLSLASKVFGEAGIFGGVCRKLPYMAVGSGERCGVEMRAATGEVVDIDSICAVGISTGESAEAVDVEIEVRVGEDDSAVFSFCSHRSHAGHKSGAVGGSEHNVGSVGRSLCGLRLFASGIFGGDVGLARLAEPKETEHHRSHQYKACDRVFIHYLSGKCISL